jgi:hypothetical protein
MRLRVIVFALVAIAVAVGLVLPSAGAKPKPPKPPKPPKSTTTTVASTTTSSSTTTTTEPTTTSSSTTTTTEPTTTSSSTTTTTEPTTTSSSTTTTVAPTTTTVPDPTIHLTGSFTYLTNGDVRYIYGGDPSLGFPVCPDGTSLDFDASVIDLPVDVILYNFLDQEMPSLIVELPIIDPTGNGDYETRTITYDYACVPA